MYNLSQLPVEVISRILYHLHDQPSWPSIPIRVHERLETVNDRLFGSTLIRKRLHENTLSSRRLHDRIPISNRLYNCALINKRFYSVTNPILWQMIPLRNEATLLKVITSLLESPRSLGHQIRCVDLRRYPDLTDAMLLLLMNRFPAVQQWYIDGADRISDASLQYLPRHCPNLTHLHLRSIPITEKTIVALGQHCHRLESLHLERCPDLSLSFFSALANCPLKQLVIPWNTTIITGNEYDTHTATETALAIAAMDQLRSLTITGVNSTLPQHLIATAQHRASNNKNPWPYLEHVSFERCDDIDNASMITFLQTHRHLQHIQLENNNFSDTVLDTLPPGVITLDLTSYHSQFTHHAVRRLIDRCQLLRWFDLSYCALGTDDFPELHDDRTGGRPHLSARSLDCLTQDDINVIRRSSGRRGQ